MAALFAIVLAAAGMKTYDNAQTCANPITQSDVSYCANLASLHEEGELGYTLPNIGIDTSFGSTAQ